ncbi:hypothetical protein VTJ49DRAFT_4591 [Mycothermus thermophilus]|uniref:F-box domain-containing protein n=1 Tax=Humicola insolens TaxID=85995 RepID=A0ABR3V524_HUMIN
MPCISDLPCEIIGNILKTLGHPRSLLPALLTCRRFYTSFKESHGVEAAICRNQIPPALLPYAVAVAEASHLPPHPRPAEPVRTLLEELYDHPARLAARYRTLPLSLIRTMNQTHDVIGDFTTGFARRALASIASARSDTEPSVERPVPAPLLPSERFRFCRAFYLVELFYAALPVPGWWTSPKRRWIGFGSALRPGSMTCHKLT